MHYKRIFMVKSFLTVFFPILFITQQISSQDTNDSVEDNNSGGFFGAPFLFYSPETKWGFGGAGLFYFYPHRYVEENTRLSNLLSSVTYTTKKQISSELVYDIYLSNNDYRFYGRLSYSKFPFSFFGIGNQTREKDEENYSPSFFVVETTFLKNLIKTKEGGLNTGLRFDYRTDRITEKEPDKLLSSRLLTGSNGGVVSGFGLSVNWDSRDNTFASTKGEYIDLKVNFYKNFLLSDYNFNSYVLDGRKFYSIHFLDTVHVIALNFVTRLSKGNVPFYMLSTFGGDKIMRGFYEGRFRDKNMTALQAEYRFPVIWRFGLVVFGNTGQVSSDISHFSISGMKFGYGIGIRFLVIPKERIGGRIDVGFSKYGSQFYLSFSEAF